MAGGITDYPKGISAFDEVNRQICETLGVAVTIQGSLRCDKAVEHKECHLRWCLDFPGPATAPNPIVLIQLRVKGREKNACMMQVSHHVTNGRWESEQSYAKKNVFAAVREYPEAYITFLDQCPALLSKEGVQVLDTWQASEAILNMARYFLAFRHATR